jgi:hypothetical protein
MEFFAACCCTGFKVWEHFEAADKLAASRLPNVKLVQASSSISSTGVAIRI